MRTLLCLCLLASAAHAQTPRYGVRDLGSTTGGVSRTFGINNVAQVAAMNRAAGEFRAFRFSQGSWSNLGTLGGPYSRAAAIGDGGHVVGLSSNAFGQARGFLWTPGGAGGVPGNPQMAEIGTFGGSGSDAAAVNALGQVAGSATDSGGQDKAFFFNGTMMLNLGLAVNASLSLPWSYAYGMNDLGDVVGEAYNNSFTTRKAFLFRGGIVTDLGSLGGSGATAFDVNNAGQITGYAGVAGGDRAFRWQSGVLQNLGTLGGNYSYGYAINRHGAVVGVSTVDAADTVSRAFLAVSNTMVDLNTLLDSTGTNWVLLEARGINDSGQITGLGLRNGFDRMFLLNPVPVIQNVSRQGSNVVLQFETANAASYVIDTLASPIGGAWAFGSNVVTGNGALVWATNAVGPALQWQRVRQIGP